MKISEWMFIFLAFLFVTGFAYLGASLYRVQVTGVAEFTRNQKTQSLRRVMVPGARGRILASGGEVLADSRACVNIVCYVSELRQRGHDWKPTIDAVDAAVNRLADVIRIPRRVSREAIERHVKRSLAMPLVIYADIDHDTLARFSEHSAEFVGFAEYVCTERVYPNGDLAAHLLGSVRRDRPDRDGGNNGSDVVHYYLPESRGRSGLELAFDDYLVGVPGERLVRVDASGYSRAEWVGSREKPGLDLSTTIDLKVQKALEDSLKGLIGAGVVLNPQNGEVIAMASSPTFDPNTFSSDYARTSKDPRKPLLNRAIREYYAPGSTFKPVTALAALREGVDAEAVVECTGVYSLGTWHLRCSSRWGHGDVALLRGLEVSCNSYFCELGHEIGVENLARAARELGLGVKTGLDIGGELTGTVPDPEWKSAHRPGEHWVTGDTCQMAIGQGMLQVTPLQMAVVCAAIANGGKIYAPYLRAKAADVPPATPVKVAGFTAEQFGLVRRGMRDVVERGTGRRIRSREGDDKLWYPLAVRCAGKTGTAEVGSGSRRRKNTWIIAFAPFDNPTVALAMVVENGQSGGTTTAPLAHQVLAAKFGEGAPVRSSFLREMEESED